MLTELRENMEKLLKSTIKVAEMDGHEVREEDTEEVLEDIVIKEVFERANTVSEDKKDILEDGETLRCVGECYPCQHFSGGTAGPGKDHWEHPCTWADSVTKDST